jgi:hypothetical protein
MTTLRIAVVGVLPNFDYIYTWKQNAMRVLDRKDQKCRVLIRGRMNSCLLEFEDGFQVVTSRNAIRRKCP